MPLRFILIFLAASLLAWWLSGYDVQLNGENRWRDLQRRGVRVAITIILLTLSASALLKYGLRGGFVFIASVVPLAIIWANCLSEFFSRCFQTLIDTGNNESWGHEMISKEMERLAVLISEARTEEATTLCLSLMESREASVLAMEAMLSRLYSDLFDPRFSPSSEPLAEACRLSKMHRFAEAESLIKSLRDREPRNLAAVVLLLRLYVCDLDRPHEAYRLLDVLGRRAQIPSGFIDFANRSVAEWIGILPSQTTEGIESLLVDRQRLKSSERIRASPP